MKKAFIQTYGCQMNEHDSHRMVALLGAEGYETTATPEEADLVLVNTCSVRHNPENKVWSQLGRLRSLKDAPPGPDFPRLAGFREGDAFEGVLATRA